EADNMLSSGEGLIRNFLYGKQLTEKLFPGYRPDTYVVPDSFGYNGNLPQIMKGCGIDYFITSKLSWNDTNHFPFEKFIWRGIDGSTVKAYMIPGSYNGENTPSFIMSMWDKITNKDVQSSQILTIGEGDGGGGTTRDDIEILKRLKDIQGCPRSSWSKVSDSLRKIFSETEDIPVYDGELYLELHRGTYTSQARTKQGYRRMNASLHNAEYMIASAWAEGRLSDSDAEKLNDEVRELWKQTVVYQFHDILPGSSVHPVYEETEAFFERALKRLDEIIRMLAGEGDEALNLSPFTQDGIPAYSSGTKNSPSVNWGEVKIKPDGTISSLKFKGREVVADTFNTLLIGEDVPCAWDAWDIEKDTVDNLKPALSRNGKIGKASSIKQNLIIHRDKARIDFVTEIDWHEDHQLLKASFDTAIRCQNAVYDIPFGFISRSTGNSNSIEEAQFEVPAQKFVALADEKLTVALLSDSKYGYSAKNGTLTVSLLKSAKAPDATADMGKHTFTYSIFVTDGGIGDVIREAEALNNPCVENTGKLTPLITVSEGLSLETVKISERGGDIIFRVREYLGIPQEGTITFSDVLDQSTLTECMMTEENYGKPTFSFHPFEIRTYRIEKR
ncbi:MAG: alpha-mannosidase, partial [Bullifex sp.]